MYLQEKAKRLPRQPKALVLLIGFLYCLLPAYSLAGSVSYDYNDAGRLIEATFDNEGQLQYDYDAVGNRLSLSATNSISSTIWEDAEDGNTLGWTIYDNVPTGASINIVTDDEISSQVVEFSGDATNNGYKLRQADNSDFNDTEHTVIQWSHKYSEPFLIYVAAETTQGFRYIYYTALNTDNLGSGTYIHHGLGTAAKDGNWQTFTRDLSYDLKDAQPDNELLSIQAFLVRGNGRIDNIKVLSSIPKNIDTDGDGISDADEISTYQTDPYEADTDGDGLSDGEELELWGTAWSQDLDGDGVINLLDADSDGDGVVDGEDANPTGGALIWEDAEDGNTFGWTIYDNVPTGASINIVTDDEISSQVVEFTGDATNNGYKLRQADGSDLGDTEHAIIQWSHKYSETFLIYVAAETTQGFRYIYYTALDTDNRGSGNYVHHGLGTAAKDGSWQTFTRDLSYDLKDAQPDNELLSIQAFLVRGSGRMDNIRLLTTIPENLDTDGDGISDADEISTYQTDPYNADTDGDGFSDGAELQALGATWNQDQDGDGVINLLDTTNSSATTLRSADLTVATTAAIAEDSTTGKLVYEDAEDGTIDGWAIQGTNAAGALIENVYDDSKGSQVIAISGDGQNDAYVLHKSDNSNWDETSLTILQWSQAFTESYTFYVGVDTTEGFRYLAYSPVDYDSLGSNDVVHHGLGSDILTGEWFTFIRNLEYDLQDAQPGNSILSVKYFALRGSGKLDDIVGLSSIPVSQDSDGDGISDVMEIDAYFTHPYLLDTDDDTIDDGAEVIYWGKQWNEDIDGDRAINVLDADADNDGFIDGVELDSGTDPGDASSYPATQAD